jgi:hypothetical protein
MDRHHLIKIDHNLSDWIEIWGTVPQGTLLAVLLFLSLMNEPTNKCPTSKYVDDTTIHHVSNNPDDNTLQEATDSVLTWSQMNNMKINPTKTKEMLVSFSNEAPHVPAISVNNHELERVSHCTLLGVHINDKLNWHDHVDKMFKKSSSRLYLISQLKRTKMQGVDIVKVYISLVRPVLEYASPVWHPGLTDYQQQLLESIQERALRIAYPSLSYEDALSVTNLTSLKSRRHELCRKLFEAAQDPAHKLYTLIPLPRVITHNQRHPSKFPLPLCKTNRFKDSFIPYCLFHFN